MAESIKRIIGYYTLNERSRYELLGEIIIVEKPTFPSSGLMDKKGIYAAWNAYKSPFAVWNRKCGRYFWYSSTNDIVKSLTQQGYIVWGKKEYEAYKAEVDAHALANLY